MNNASMRTKVKTSVNILGSIVLLVGCIVLIGWIFDIPVFKSLSPKWFAMKVNAAIGFLLSGIILLGFHKWPKTSKALSLLVALIGLCTLLEYIFSIDLGIDQLFFREETNAIGTISPGRMAIIAAVDCFLVGLSFFIALSQKETRRETVLFHISQILMSIAFFLSLFSIYIYIICSGETFGFILSRYILMAFHAAFTFVLTAIGFYLLTPDRGVASMFLGKSIGSFLARNLILPLFFILPTMFYLLIMGEKAGWFSSSFGTVIMLTTVTVIIDLLIFFTAIKLNNLDNEKTKQTEELLKTKLKVEKGDVIYKSIIQTTMDGFWLTDLKGNFIEVNRSYCKMSGYSEQELLTMSISDVEVHEKKPDTDVHIQKIIAHGEDHFESKHFRKDGSIFDVEVNVQHKTIEDGQLVTFIKDITERKQAEEEIKKLNEALERRVIERTYELNKTIEQLEEQTKVFVGREMRMIELKKQIEELEKKIAGDV